MIKEKINRELALALTEFLIGIFFGIILGKYVL